MSLDVASARQLLEMTLASAVDAARENTSGQTAIAVEELAAWERVGAVVLPAMTPAALALAGRLVDDERLRALAPARDRAVIELEHTREELEQAVLDSVDLDEITARRTKLEHRLNADRMRLREMRLRPGLQARLDEFKRGARLKDDALAQVRSHEELRVNTETVEAELARLSAATARHHRARHRLAELADQKQDIEAGFLRDGRRIVVECLLAARPQPWPDRPDLGAMLRVVEGVAAKRECLTWMYETWVRPHGNALLALQQEGRHVSGFETVSWPPKVDLLCRDTAIALDAWRRSAKSLLAFSGYTGVPAKDGVCDWWAALLPGVRRAEGPPSIAPVVRAASDMAEDKLAAAWASFSEPDGAAIDDPFLGPVDADDMAIAAASGVFRQFDQALAPSRKPIPGFDEPTDNPFASQPTHADLAADFVSVDVVRPTFSNGSRVGRFLVEGLIGKGGMGEVYRARLLGEGGFSRPVVLKRIGVERRGDDDIRRAFAREAELAARIAHPNVVQIFDVQMAGDETFIVMELLEGLSLQKLMLRARRETTDVPMRVLTRCALDAARGLHAAHSLRGDDGALVGLVHRDVSPDNLFLCHNGFTKLLDFGIARRSDLTTMTGKNELKGKIPYMSPEQITGEPLDARSDLFSLGSTLYWVLTGLRPFAGDTEINTLYAVVNKAHQPLASQRADAGGLGAVIEQLLRKRPDDRPASALAAVKLLEACGPATPEETAAFLARIWEQG